MSTNPEGVQCSGSGMFGLAKLALLSVLYGVVMLMVLL